MYRVKVSIAQTQPANPSQVKRLPARFRERVRITSSLLQGRSYRVRGYVA